MVSKEGWDYTDSEEDTRTANFTITSFLVGASLEGVNMVCGLITWQRRTSSKPMSE